MANKVIRRLYWFPPVVFSGLAIYLLWRASQLDGAASERVFFWGLLTLLGTALWVWLGARRRRTFEEQAAEERDAAQGREIIDLEHRIAAVERAFNSKLGMWVFLDAHKKLDDPKVTWADFTHD